MSDQQRQNNPAHRQDPEYHVDPIEQSSRAVCPGRARPRSGKSGQSASVTGAPTGRTANKKEGFGPVCCGKAGFTREATSQWSAAKPSYSDLQPT